MKLAWVITSGLLGLNAFAGPVAASRMCLDLLNPDQVYSTPAVKRGEVKLMIQPRYFKHQGRELAYSYKPASSPDIVTNVVIHGLGDDMTRMKPLAEEILDRVGWDHGSLLVDLHGHGLTQKRLRSTHTKTTQIEKEKFSYKYDIEDIVALISSLGLKNVNVIGHSLGGGVGFEVSARLSNPEFNHIKLHHTVIMAPYAQREDVALKNMPQTAQYWVQETVKQLSNAGMNAEKVDSIFNPLFELYSQYNYYPQLLNSIIYNFWGVQKVKDFVQDPLMDGVILVQYKKYFVKRAENELGRKLDEKELADIEDEAQVTLDKVKSLRDLNWLDPLFLLPKVEGDVLVIAGINDPLVVIAQMKELGIKFERSGIKHAMKVLEGAKAGHFFPMTMVKETSDVIGEFINP